IIFFSSRRRHTRFSRDWSSDVCSSDLLQAIDLDFINWAGKHGIPLAFVYTKADKLSAGAVLTGRKKIESALLAYWQELPDGFVTSSVKKKGRDELLDFIGVTLKGISQND